MQTVKKGAGRGTHAAKTNKHAQRTPLPSKRRTTEEVAAETADRSAALRPEPQSDGLSKSSVKGKAFADQMRPLGWEITPAWGETDVKDHVTVTAIRGAEIIFIEWMGGVFQPTATYSHGDRVIKMRNAAQCIQYAVRAPEQAAEETKKVASNRFFRKAERPAEELEAQRQPLPFDPGTALEDEILAQLAGRRVTWLNRISQTPESAVFPVEYHKQFTHITEYEGERIVNFVEHGGQGFRSFRLSGLLSVSRGKSVTVKRTEQIARRAAAGAKVSAR